MRSSPLLLATALLVSCGAQAPNVYFLCEGDARYDRYPRPADLAEARKVLKGEVTGPCEARSFDCYRCQAKSLRTLEDFGEVEDIPLLEAYIGRTARQAANPFESSEACSALLTIAVLANRVAPNDDGHLTAFVIRATRADSWRSPDLTWTASGEDRDRIIRDLRLNAAFALRLAPTTAAERQLKDLLERGDEKDPVILSNCRASLKTIADHPSP